MEDRKKSRLDSYSWGFFLGGGNNDDKHEGCEYPIFTKLVCILEIGYYTFTPSGDSYLRNRGYCILESTDIKADFINVLKARLSTEVWFFQCKAV